MNEKDPNKAWENEKYNINYNSFLYEITKVD